MPKSRKKSLKRQLRDTQRLLSRKDLPETICLEKNRVLSLLEQEMRQRKEEKKKRRNKFDNKYKMVMFFERRKIQRRLNSALKDIANINDTTSEEERESRFECVQQLRADLNYVLHFPPSKERYYALYPTKPSVERKTIERRAVIYKQILENVKEGVLKDMLLEVPYCGGHLDLIKAHIPDIDTLRLPIATGDTEGLPSLGNESERTIVKEGLESSEYIGSKKRKYKQAGNEERKKGNHSRARKLSPLIKTDSFFI